MVASYLSCGDSGMKGTAWGKHVACFSALLTLMQVYKSFVIRRSTEAGPLSGVCVRVCVCVCVCVCEGGSETKDRLKPVGGDGVVRIAVPVRKRAVKTMCRTHTTYLSEHPRFPNTLHAYML